MEPPEEASDRANEHEGETKGFVTLPYLKGTTEAISQLLHKAGFKVAVKPHRTLRQQLVAPKDHTSTLDKAGVVYRISCNECDSSYIGHTSKNLRDRVKQHKSATDKGKTTDSAIADHAWSSHHTIDWENVEVLDQESTDRRRIIKESLFIRSKCPRMNRDLGLEVSQAYNGIIPRYTKMADGFTQYHPRDVTTF